MNSPRVGAHPIHHQDDKTKENQSSSKVYDDNLIFNWQKFVQKVEVFAKNWCDFKDMVHFVKSRPSIISDHYQSIFQITTKNDNRKYEIKTILSATEFELFVLSRESDKYGKLKVKRGEHIIELHWGGVWRMDSEVNKIKLEQLSSKKLVYIPVQVELNQNFQIEFNGCVSASQSLEALEIEKAMGALS